MGEEQTRADGLEWYVAHVRPRAETPHSQSVPSTLLEQNRGKVCVGANHMFQLTLKPLVLLS